VAFARHMSVVTDTVDRHAPRRPVDSGTDP
jgi:hypothetical protein